MRNHVAEDIGLPKANYCLIVLHEEIVNGKTFAVHLMMVAVDFDLFHFVAVLNNIDVIPHSEFLVDMINCLYLLFVAEKLNLDIHMLSVIH